MGNETINDTTFNQGLIICDKSGNDILNINASDFFGECKTIKEVESRRSKILQWGEKLKQLPQVEWDVKHRFAGGLYLREIKMAKGSFVIGKIHSTQHFNIIVSGECLVASVDGVQHIKAPYTFVSEAGVQKCVLNITDVIWQTTHVTNETNIDTIVNNVTVNHYSELDIDFIVDKIVSKKL